MPRPGEDWSLEEVEATVSDYFEMFAAELAGLRVNKSEHRNRLLKLLRKRNAPAVEFKHANISAVLRERGLPYIRGYKPRGNFQALLEQAILRHLERHPILFKDLARTEPAIPVPSRQDNRPIDSILDAPPTRTVPAFMRETEHSYVARKRDFAQLEARRRQLGERGELFVLAFERRRLEEHGRGDLAREVVRVSETEGDGAGFDIRSFGLDDSERFIEVKTTTFGKTQPFLVSSNEVDFSSDHQRSFQLYRVFQFSETPRLFVLPGSIRNTCNLEPVQYRASF